MPLTEQELARAHYNWKKRCEARTRSMGLVTQETAERLRKEDRWAMALRQRREEAIRRQHNRIAWKNFKRDLADAVTPSKQAVACFAAFIMSVSFGFAASAAVYVS